MSESLVSFGENVVALGFDLDQRVADWQALRLKMLRQMAEGFTRDEWAYILAFLDAASLQQSFAQSFGARVGGKVRSLFRARGSVGIWLPNNVSLLGPLVLILCSFTGARIRLKAGSRSDDLCQAFVIFAVQHLPAGQLRDYLAANVLIERFDRDDERNRAMAAESDVRIVFGSDAATTAIHALPHPIGSTAISFADHQSEAWVQMAALDDASIVTLIKVFAIYGQAGCTSPRRVIVIDGTIAECQALRTKMMELWPRRDVAIHVASQNILHLQLAKAAGWDVRMAHRNAAVLGVGSLADGGLAGQMSLVIVPATVNDAMAALPVNIQTVGHRLLEADARPWQALVARTPIKRWLPVGNMHHFGAVWDGANFWRQLFEEVVFYT